MNPVNAFLKAILMPYVWIAVVMVGFILFVQLPSWLMITLVVLFIGLAITSIIMAVHQPNQ